MKRYEATIHIPQVMRDALQNSRSLELLGTIGTFQESALVLHFYRGRNFFIMLSASVHEETGIDVWFDDEIEDLKDYLVNELRSSIDFEEAHIFIPDIQKILTEVNRIDPNQPPLSLGDGSEITFAF